MVTKEDPLWDEIVRFIENGKWNNFGFWKKPATINRDTELEKDLRITGSDAEDFMTAFHEQFPFEIGDFHLSDYFQSEGFLVLPLFKKRGGGIKPLTLGMLENAVRNGAWK